MREYIDAFTLANEIRMTRSAYQGAFVIVERPTDATFYKRFFDKMTCQIVTSHNKDNAIGTLSILEQASFKGILAIVNANFWIIQKLQISSKNLILTDGHDVETMLFQSPAFQKILTEFGSEDKILLLEQERGKEVLTVILEIGRQIGYLRWISFQEQLLLEFENLHFDNFIDEERLSIDINMLISKTEKYSPDTRNEDLLEKITIQAHEDHNVWHICSGHDLVQILSISLRKAVGTNNVIDVRPDILTKHLRSSYEKTDFKKSKLYSSIIKWEDEHKPFIIVSDDVRDLANSKLRFFLKAIDKLEELINNNARENDFQSLLEKNEWMFGSEYQQRLDRRAWVLDEQQDFMLKRTTDGYLELIEIKTPIDGKPLFLKDQSHNSFYPRSELSEVIGQVTNYLESLDAERYRIKAQTGEDVSKIRAKIIIGRSISREQEQAIHLHNSYHNRMEVITYDQLLLLSKQVIEHQRLVLTD